MADDRSTGPGDRDDVDRLHPALLDGGKGSQPGGRAEPNPGDGGLDGVSEVETVGDVVDVAAFGRRLPGGWGVGIEVVPFEDEPLAEVLVFRRSAEDPRLLLKPVEMADPRGRVECFERRRFEGRRDRILATDSLEAALRAATNWVHQRRG